MNSCGPCCWGGLHSPRCARGGSARRLVDLEELDLRIPRESVLRPTAQARRGSTDLEDERRLSGDHGGETALAVSVVGRANEARLLANAQLRDAFVPA